MKNVINLRINRANAKWERVTASFTRGTSRRRATRRDAAKHGFHVSPADAPDVLALIEARIQHDNDTLDPDRE
jgi:hypothetical protein